MRSSLCAALLLCAGAAFSAEPAPAGPPNDAPTPAEKRLAAFCRDASFDADAVLADPKAARDAGGMPLSEFHGLSEYAACRELAGAPGGCRALSSSGDLGRTCGFLAWQARLAKAVISGGDAAGVCASHPAPGKLGPTALKRVCAQYASSAAAGKPAALCDALRAEQASTGDDRCRDHQVFWSGRLQDCDRLSSPAVRDECRELSAYVAGLRSSPACASSGLCAGTCGSYKALMAKGFCARIGPAILRWAQADKKKSEQEEAAVHMKVEQAEKEAELKRIAAAKAKADAGRKPQFKEGQSMRTGETLSENMSRVEKGLPIIPPKKDEAEDGDGKK